MNELSACNGVEIQELDLSATNDLSDSEMSPVAPLPFDFDYSGVSAAIAREAEDVALRIRNRHRASIIDTGKDLLAVKDKLGHGKFGDWLRFQFSMTERTAENYMNAARAFGSAPRVVDVLPTSTVYKLAAKGIPAAIRQSVVDAIAAGTALCHKDVEARVAAAKADARRERQEEREWEKHEKGLKGAGKTGEEVEAERKRWKRKREQKAPEVANQLSVAKKQQEQANPQEERRKQQERLEQQAARVADILRKNLGDDFEKFRELVRGIVYPEFRRAFEIV